MSELRDSDYETGSEGPADAAAESGTADEAGEEPSAEAGESGPAEAETDSGSEGGSSSEVGSGSEQADPGAGQAETAGSVAPEPGEASPTGEPDEAGPAEAPGESAVESSATEPAEPDSPSEAEVDAGQTEPAEPEPGDTAEPVAETGEGGSDNRGGADDQAADDAVPGEGVPAEADQDVPSDAAGRPDVSKQHPDVFKEQDASGLTVDRAHESPESWIGNINPGNGRNNCGECARAVQATWSGDPSVAATLNNRLAGGEPNECMPQWAGQDSKPATMQQVSDRLTELGPGSSAVVGFDRNAGSGHWFNAINDGGVIKAVDGQSGNIEPWPPSTADDGLGFDESEMKLSDAIFFDPDGAIIR
jgi:hypothetical protein